MSTELIVRPATPHDAATIARHRVAMYLDIGSLAEADAPALEAATREWLARTLVDGGYVGWLAAPAHEPATIVGGAGMLLRGIQPRPGPKGGVTTGTQGLVVNVYTRPDWRRRGVGRQVLTALLDGARALRLTSVVLHASDAGRPLYEQLGFVPTNEMRYGGEL